MAPPQGKREPRPFIAEIPQRAQKVTGSPRKDFSIYRFCNSFRGAKGDNGDTFRTSGFV
jgi:hypothetical protein